MTIVVKVKICGLTRLCDIETVNKEMPDYVGFVFAESHRKVTSEQAMELRNKLRPEISAVGVFVDAEIEDILYLTKKGTIDMIQLHGTEDEDYILNLKSLTDKPIIKAVCVQHKGDAQKWNDTSADYLLLDHKSGGTGEAFDWDLIGEVGKPYFLAGGLNIENVGTAINQITPFAVDVSSGVEVGGFKDLAKIKEFIRRVRNGN